MMKLAAGPITVTHNELKELLFGVKGAHAITITTRTIPELIGGKKCELAGLEKVAVTNGMINFSYEKAVNRVREKDGNENVFEAEPRRWGSRLHSESRMLPLVDKQRRSSPNITARDLQFIPPDGLYLEMKVQKVVAKRYYLDGVEIDEGQVTHFLRPERDSEVKLRDFSLKSLEQVLMGGETYLVGSEIY